MVPNGWKKVKLIETASKAKYSFTGGPFGSDLKSSDYTQDGVRIIQLQNIGDGKFYNDYKIFTSKEKADNLISCNIFPGDIILSKMGDPVARATIIPNHHERYLMASDGIRLKVNEEQYDTYFIHEVINSPFFRNVALSKSTGSTRKRIGLTDLRNIPFLSPPLPEQRKIAKILSTWDKAISTTECLIDNSKQQKKALMQQLLTGKKRLLDDSGKPFEGEWVDLYLHEVAKIIVSPVDKKIIKGEIPVELCNYTDVYYNTRITKSLDFMKATAKPSEIDKYTLQVNDVLITKDSETPGDIAIPALVSEDLGGTVCGYHLAIIRPNSRIVEGAYLNYLFSMPKTRYYFFTLATGATRFGLSVGGINKAHFTLPPLEEQQKIAAVITNSDKEIELLEQQLADLKQEKKALMQQLLTGKKRVLI